MSRLEVSNLFKLNINEDIKWCIYNTLWKHVYPIDTTLKQELLDKSLFHQVICEYMTSYKEVAVINMTHEELLNIRVFNCTNYLDAMLFDMTKYFDELDYVMSFSCVCRLSDEEQDSQDNQDRINVDIVFFLQSSIEHKKDKLAYLYKLWNKLSVVEKLFLMNVSIIESNNILLGAATREMIDANILDQPVDM